MTDQILFDRLVYIDRLKRGGIAEDQARAHAEAMDSALREGVSTRADVDAIKIASAAVEGQLKSIRADLDSKLDRAVSDMTARIDLAVKDMTIRLGGIVAIGIAALAAI
jgi:hypothetical protein